MGPGAISPSRVPLVYSTGRVRAMIFWYFISQADSLQTGVLPQWKPIKVSVRLYGYAPLIFSAYRSAGTLLLMSSRVTASRLTQVPINSDSTP